MRRSVQLNVTVLLLLINLALSACGTVSEPAEQAEQTPFDLHAAFTKLENFSSYASEFSVTWDGIREAEPVAGRLDMERVQIREPAAQEIFATVRQENAETHHIIALVQTGGQNWFYHQDQAGTWQEISGQGLDDYRDKTFFTPETFFKDFDLRIDSPILQPPEKVNDVLARRYNFDAENLTSDHIEFREAHGYVHVSAEGRSLVEFYMNADVIYHTPDRVIESGKIRVNLEVSDVGRPFTVEPPRITRTDIPLPPDVSLPDPTPVPLSRRADQGSTFDNRITYQTGDNLAEITNLYQTAMPQHGWEALTYNIPLDPTSRDTIHLQYTKNDEGVIIGIDHKQDTTAVRLNFELASDMQENICSAFKCGILILTDFPIAPDARIMTLISGGGMAGQMHYQTRGSVDEIMHFYATAMPAEGWTEAVPVDYTAKPDEVTVGYGRNKELVVIHIKNAQDVTEVLVETGPANPIIQDYPHLEDLQLMREFPILPDAKINKLLPGQLTYRTTISLTDVEQFYETTLSTEGWSLRPGGVHNPETIISRYEKELTTATLMIKQDLEKESIVWITLYRR